MRPCARATAFEYRNLFAVILQDIAAGLSDARSGDVDDAACRHTHYVAAVDLDVESGVAGLQQILETDCDGLWLGVRWIPRCIRFADGGMVRARDDHNISGVVRDTSRVREYLKKSRRAQNLKNRGLHHRPDHRNRLAFLFLDKDGDLGWETKPFCNQELGHFLFELECAHPRRLNLIGDQGIADIANVANPNIARKFRNVEDINMQQIARADGCIPRLRPGKPCQFAYPIVGLLLRFLLATALADRRKAEFPIRPKKYK